MRLGERRSLGTTSHLYSRTVAFHFFRLCWVVILIWGELGIFFWSLSSCRWPNLKDSTEKPTRVLLISDPQVRPPSDAQKDTLWSSRIRQFIFDLNMKKSWHVTTRLQPHAVIFLGDMLASGKSIKNETEYQQYVQKFQSIFKLSPSVLVHYIPGNNDVGMGVSPSFSKITRSHYLKSFGPFNQRVDIRNHSFILLDAPGLVDEDYQRSAYGVGFEKWHAIPEGVVSFVRDIKRDVRPLILFSHIPLSRLDTASCGPLREKGTIRRGVGHGYQNTFGKQTTTFLFGNLQLSAIFSGDNRDYCDYTHDHNNVREVTVKSFSMSNHIRRPGFQLLSLVNPSSSSTTQSFLDTPCLLPDQYGIYSSLYVPFFVFSAVVLLVLNLRRSRRGGVHQIEPLIVSPHNGSSPSSSGHSTPVPHPESDVWSPYTPATLVSPRGILPSSLRTANGHGSPAAFRASRPVTPLASPFLPPAIYTPEEEDESMYPTQYVVRRDGRSQDTDSWSSGHERISDSQIPHFTSAPGWKPTVKRGWSWSWTFVFRGRRRRVTLRVPEFARGAFSEVQAWSIGRGDKPMLVRHRGVLYMTMMDVFSILWPAAILWVLVTWWMF